MAEYAFPIGARVVTRLGSTPLGLEDYASEYGGFSSQPRPITGRSDAKNEGRIYEVGGWWWAENDLRFI